MRITIINGANLNLLGVREPGIYGNQEFGSFLKTLIASYKDVQIDYYQSNVEGEIINLLQDHGFNSDGIILNAGGYTHTSIAIADAVAAIEAPVVEVHISNILARETERKTSLISKHCKGLISGLVLQGYELALVWLTANLKTK